MIFALKHWVGMHIFWSPVTWEVNFSFCQCLCINLLPYLLILYWYQHISFTGVWHEGGARFIIYYKMYHQPFDLVYQQVFDLVCQQDVSAAIWPSLPVPIWSSLSASIWSSLSARCISSHLTLFTRWITI